MVKVTVDAPALKTTLQNSCAFPGRAAKVIVCDTGAVNVTVAVPADQLAEVEAFVHEPATIQDSEPKTM